MLNLAPMRSAARTWSRSASVAWTSPAATLKSRSTAVLAGGATVSTALAGSVAALRISRAGPSGGSSSPKNYKEGGYLPKIPKDPWGNEYRYLSPGQNGEIDIYSLGRDGQQGGEGFDADIGNWNMDD